MNDEKTETEAIQVARITRNQAIVVAVITAVGGFITALLAVGGGLFNSGNVEVAQRWVKIEEVRVGDDFSVQRIDRVRITAQVNGVSYSFPTNTVWATLGKDMAGEKFPLPVGLKTFRIKFTGFGTAAGETGAARFDNRDAAEFKVSQLPLRNMTQSLNYTASASNVPASGLVVRYSVE